MRRQLHRDVRPLPGLGARRNWSATVATSGCKAREAPRPFAMGRPGDDATADEPIAPPLPRDRARAPRCSFRRNARPPSKASQPSSRCWNTQHVPEIGGDYDAAGIETGLDGERLGSRELWTTITVAALRQVILAHILRDQPAPASTTSRRARAAPSTRPGRKPLSTTTSDSGPANSSEHRRCTSSDRRTSSATSVAAPADDFETRAPGAVDSAARRGRP